MAGGSGFIGHSLIQRIQLQFPNARITAFSRKEQVSLNPRLEWRVCDLFSLASIEVSMPAKVDVAIYLVHSMEPTAQLDQGGFEDFDLLLADNFARALSTRNVQKLIYLGGLVPENDLHLSRHLKSRNEIEDCFRLRQIPTTVLRAGLILGSEGSSFQILTKLIRRLPVLICPAWTQTLTTPIDLELVLDVFCAEILHTDKQNITYDLSGCVPITYRKMMEETSRFLGLKRFFCSVPFFTPGLSKLWVTLITRASKGLVYPLVESLEHPMVARTEHLHPQCLPLKNYPEILHQGILKQPESRLRFRFRVRRKTVRSIQRMTLPKGHSVDQIVFEYFKWLPEFIPFGIGVFRTREGAQFYFLSKKLVLLRLAFRASDGPADRVMMYITGGLLVAKNNVGQFEFRSVLNGDSLLIAIHDFRPSLPWFVYRWTQALIHGYVMKKFAQHLEGFKKASGKIF